MTRVISGNEVIEGWQFDPRDLKAVKNKKVVIIQAGDDSASDTYVRNKCRKLTELGIISQRVIIPHTFVSDMLREITETIDAANANHNVIGIMCQLPLYFDLQEYEQYILNLIDPDKDIDNLSDFCLGHLLSHSKEIRKTGMCYVPATPRGIARILNYIQGTQFCSSYYGKRAVVIGRSRLVGLPMASILGDKNMFNMTVTVLHSWTSKEDLKKYTRMADVIIVAVGKPKFLTEDMIDEERQPIVIDVGTNYVDGKLVGDVDFENVAPKCSAITPVPGGVGKVTVHALMHNIIDGQSR